MSSCPRCGESAETHAAGRCLDAWVFEAVEGKWEYDPAARAVSFDLPFLWGRRILWADYESPQAAFLAWLEEGFRPSTQIQDAWEVAQLLRLIVGPNGPRYLACDSWQPGMSTVSAEAETAPLAICRAALLAVEGRDE